MHTHFFAHVDWRCAVIAGKSGKFALLHCIVGFCSVFVLVFQRHDAFCEFDGRMILRSVLRLRFAFDRLHVIQPLWGGSAPHAHNRVRPQGNAST